MQCYIGYRIHYHLLQMLGRKKIEEKEYKVIGHKHDLKDIAESANWYAIHDYIKKLNLKLSKISSKNDDKMQLDTHILFMKAIVDKEKVVLFVHFDHLI